MRGRKPIYAPETLEIGQKIELRGKNKDFAHQYAYQFRRKNEPKIFKKVVSGKKIFIERVS